MAALKPAPADFAVHGLIESRPELLVRYGISEKVLKRWFNMLGPAWRAERLERRVTLLDNFGAYRIPDGFCELAMGISIAALAKRCGVTKPTVSKWLRAMPDEWQAERRASCAPPPRVRKPYVAKPAKSSKGRASYGTKAPPPPIADGPAAQAVRFLQMHYRPVYTMTISDPRAVGLYAVGKQVLPAADMLALAAKHGFDVDAWRRMPADVARLAA